MSKVFVSMTGEKEAAGRRREENEVSKNERKTFSITIYELINIFYWI